MQGLLSHAHSFAATLNIPETVLCSLNAISFVYTTVLGSFLYAFLDIDHIITPIAEAAINAIFAAAIVSLKIYFKDGFMYVATATFIGTAIVYNIIRINRKYVRGK